MIFRKLRNCDGARVPRYAEVRYEGRKEEHERRVAQVLRSETREAPRGPRIHMLHEHQVLLQVGEREKEFVKKQDALGAPVTHCKVSKTLTLSRSSTRANDTKLGTPGGATESPVAN